MDWLTDRSSLKEKSAYPIRRTDRFRAIVGWPGKRTKGILVVLALASVALLGVIVGMWLQRKDLPSRAISAVHRKLIQTIPLTQVVPWRDVNTNLHVIQVAIARISGVTIDGGSLAEVGGNILIASPHGQLSYLDARYQLHSLDLRVPMNIEGLRKDPLYKQPLFNVAFFRTHALLAIRTGANSYDLYASFNRFAGTCFEFVVGKVSLEVNDEIVRPTSSWSDVWTANPCVPLKDRGYLFVGIQSGGRMVRRTDDTILVAVGDHQMDGFYDSRAVSMDPTNDLGKLIELNIKTGASRHFAVGLRNPLGLTIAPDGRIWETENGPQGGDEVNLMIEGRNYGWPIVTYGMVYGYPPKNWPFNPRPGRHDGYTRPRFAFVPSVAPTSIIAPDPREFPNWSDSLLMCSLRGNTLYVLKTDGDDIVYAEPIHFDGYRLRDIISMPDGRLAILADDGSLLLVRNAEMHRKDAQHIEVRGLSSLPPPSPEEAPSPSAMTTEERGHAYFLGACANCHGLAGEIGIGPPLNGVIGRRVAAVPDFGYSAALASRHDAWTESLMKRFITNPQSVAHGTRMPETGLGEVHAEAIAAYLKTTRGPK
ncbi:MAG TPA: PQQ-dependent sugar dehydrogenase [Candidatus Binataceae bacterium]|nr:PQQ-dependent sugar dehydrogenase [Candidatus Binataceae bacterium]